MTQVKTEILEAASGLFARHGYRGTSIAAVAERVGITDAGVLYHFKTKEALLLGVLSRYGTALDEEIASSGAQGIRLLRKVRECGAGMERRPEISALLTHLSAEHVTQDGPARRFLQAAYRRALDRYTAAFATAASEGDLHADLDPVAEARALIAYLDGIRLQWFLADRSFSMADSVRRHVDDALGRLATR
jgi:AcrR family transcriptional regulator